MNSTAFNINNGDAEWTSKIDALAARLGVEPEPIGGRSDGQIRYLLAVNNGARAYNLLDMVNAVLDRIDAATR
ncbi:MAG: hypothetical protein E6Q97_15185 [Desulfurellales bacterium]|nr:MAG: hypothetical protein E6Q97_15185 [Desulfurellales bacterium]